MPMKGGSCVSERNTGTASSVPIPMQNIRLRSKAGGDGRAASLVTIGATTSRPRIM